MAKKKIYPFIRAWGEYTRRTGTDIEATVAKAATAKVPETVICEINAEDGSGPTGDWMDIADHPDKALRKQISLSVKKAFPDWKA